MKIARYSPAGTTAEVARFLTDPAAYHRTVLGDFVMQDPPEGDPADPPKPEPQDPPKPDEPPSDPAAAAVWWKAKAEANLGHSRTWESRAKANKDAADKLAKIEEDAKSEQQKQQDALVAAQKQAADASAKAMRYEVATKVGLTGTAQSLFLEHANGDEAAMTSYAEGLLAIAATATPPPDPNAPRRPAPTVTQGQAPAAATTSVKAGEELYAARHKKAPAQ